MKGRSFYIDSALFWRFVIFGAIFWIGYCLKYDGY